MSDKAAAVVNAIAQLVNMALEYAGYRLALYVLGMLALTPLQASIAFILVNFALIGYILSSWSTKVVEWIRCGVTWLWSRLRRKEKSPAIG